VKEVIVHLAALMLIRAAAGAIFVLTTLGAAYRIKRNQQEWLPLSFISAVAFGGFAFFL